MNIELIVYRMRIGLFYCCHLKVKGLNHLSFFELLIILSLLLLKSGDVQPNPGPGSEFSFISSSLNSSHLDTKLENKFSIVHCNIQSFTNKKDIQSTLVISTSVISNNRLSRKENLIPVLT